MSERKPVPPMAGKHLPWDRVSGFFVRVDSFLPLAPAQGGRMGAAASGGFGSAIAELPHPGVEPAQRLFHLPIQHKSDYKSLFLAHGDLGVRNRTTELIVLHEPRQGLLGGKRACLHVAAYPAGTWQAFFDAASRYAAEEFCWPNALFLYQPSATKVFPAAANLFVP